ncbi:hypothetical protein ONS95_010985 [Cadophora gregata]|uniref:uncharacterized protein n=1 Tax=Cadophora gregata TaxID=51156 RepID=UPI0026DC7DD6|nr:uncharacterized protein ONS95_010985 [Cadophora gregata]KAK0119545.1 hypothetical protein ONS95_010985 [Cadophora gregata]
MAPANSDKHPKMQARVEDFEDVDPADDVPLKATETPIQEASMGDLPAGEIPTRRTDNASDQGSGTTISQPTASTLPDLVNQLANRLENLPPLKPVLFNCNKCRKTEPSVGAFKKKCRCKAVVYCGKECKKEDLKEHKRQCGDLGNRSSELASQTAEIVQAQIEFHHRQIAIATRQELEKSTPESAMQHWINAFRLLVLDNTDAAGNRRDHRGLLDIFEDFLMQLSGQDKYWAPWLQEKQGRKACIALAKDKNSWYYIERRVTAKELQEQWAHFPHYVLFLRHLQKIARGQMISAEEVLPMEPLK